MGKSTELLPGRHRIVSLMKAAVVSGFSTIQIKDVDKPVPADDEVLVRVRATTICAADYRVKQMWPMRFVLGTLQRKKHTILGMEVAGTVEAVGKAVTRFRAGDEVFGGTGFKLGAHAEYVCARDFMVEKKPVNMTLEESAAVIFGGLTALCNLRLVKIEKGQNVLVYGASGSVGVYAVQLAKHFGARVTAVCSTANLDMVRSLGADSVVDYTREDFSKAGRVYDVIFDAVGKSGYARGLRALKKGRPYIMVAPTRGVSGLPLDVIRQQWISLRGAAKFLGGVTKPLKGDVTLLRDLIEAGELRTVIDRRYRLDEIAEAVRYAEAGHKKGHVLVLVA